MIIRRIVNNPIHIQFCECNGYPIQQSDPNFLKGEWTGFLNMKYTEKCVAD